MGRLGMDHSKILRKEVNKCMKISINDSHENYIFLTEEEIFHDIVLNGVNFRNVELFMMLLKYF